jgi:serine/threonine-protein kinase
MLKKTVIYALSDLRGPRVADSLTKALKDPVEDVRAAGVRALGNLGDPATLPQLVESLKDTSPIVARAAVETLSTFKDPRLLGPFMQMLKHQDTGVVERALEAVAAIGDKRAEEAFIYFAAKGNPRMKAIALKGLGSMDSERCLRGPFEKGPLKSLQTYSFHKKPHVTWGFYGT